MPEIDRRNFLKLVGASAGAAAAAGCSDPVEKLIPYVVQPEVITPGLPVIYASTCQECPAGCGLHVRTREGRPIKLEGNPNHPINRGALCARGQAGIGRTYLPDRYPGPMRRQSDGSYSPITWAEAHALLAEKVRAAGNRTRILSGLTGPTLTGLIGNWNEALGAGERVVYQPFEYSALKQASNTVFGASGTPIFELSNADFVIDFGSDFLESWVSPIEHGREFADARSIADHAEGGARLVYVGSRLSMTAGNADEWLPAKPGTEGILALGIAKAALDHAARRGSAPAEAEAVAGLLARYGSDSVASLTEVPAATITRLGAQLVDAEAPVALPPGIAALTTDAVSTTAAVLILNVVIGAVGTTVRVTPESAAPGQVASYAEVAKLVDAMKSGGVSVLIVHASNPAYSMPAASGFGDALAKVDFVVSTASGPDETSERAHLILPDHTPMESWGDQAPRPGVRSLVQPTIRPLFDSQAFGDTLIGVAKAAGVDAGLPGGSFREVLERAWSDTNFRAALAAGGVFSGESVGGGAVLAATAANIEVSEPRLQGDGLTLLAIPSPLLSDGSGANLPWLQETPDPVMKVAWQSWAEVSHDTAEALGVEFGDVVSVQTPAGRVELPVLPRGGIRDDVVAIQIGQGHSVGFYASRADQGAPGESRGVSVISILPAATDEAGGRAWLTTRAQVRGTGAHRRIAKTEKFDNKRDRQLGDTISLVALAKASHASDGHGDAHAGSHGAAHAEGHEMIVAYDPVDDSDEASPYRWGMTIDLDRCNGCSACIVACSIENNVVNVGEELVLLDRQMSWLRIERYIGDGDQELVTGRPRPTDHERLGNVDVRHSPMMCQQCGAAPCEPVCPVYATYHTPEGLNGMIYNRCIGTRYCSNNCPYKVRRYNWYDYAIENIHAPLNLLTNPDVTVRGQGVMEKCTFCVQRIENGRQLAKDEGRPIADGEVTPACAQTCPTRAITFGNLKDAGSQAVQKADAAGARSYHALQVLNTRPAISYLKKVTRGPEEMEG